MKSYNKTKNQNYFYPSTEKPGKKKLVQYVLQAFQNWQNNINWLFG